MTDPTPAYPDVLVYATREPDGKLAPVACSVGGLSFPVLDGEIAFSPNATRHGTRAMTATLTFPIGGGGLEVVESPDEIPELAHFYAVSEGASLED